MSKQKKNIDTVRCPVDDCGKYSPARASCIRHSSRPRTKEPEDYYQIKFENETYAELRYETYPGKKKFEPRE